MRGSHRGWDDLGVIAPVRDLAEEAWTQLRKLAKGDDDAAQAAMLDALRRDYVRLYAEAEGIVASSIDAAVPSGPPEGCVPGRVRTQPELVSLSDQSLVGQELSRDVLGLLPLDVDLGVHRGEIVGRQGR